MSENSLSKSSSSSTVSNEDGKSEKSQKKLSIFTQLRKSLSQQSIEETPAQRRRKLLLTAAVAFDEDSSASESIVSDTNVPGGECKASALLRSGLRELSPGSSELLLKSIKKRNSHGTVDQIPEDTSLDDFDLPSFAEAEDKVHVIEAVPKDDVRTEIKQRFEALEPERAPSLDFRTPLPPPDDVRTEIRQRFEALEPERAPSLDFRTPLPPLDDVRVEIKQRFEALEPERAPSLDFRTPLPPLDDVRVEIKQRFEALEPERAPSLDFRTPLPPLDDVRVEIKQRFEALEPERAPSLDFRTPLPSLDDVRTEIRQQVVALEPEAAPLLDYRRPLLDDVRTEIPPPQVTFLEPEPILPDDVRVHSAEAGDFTVPVPEKSRKKTECSCRDIKIEIKVLQDVAFSDSATSTCKDAKCERKSCLHDPVKKSVRVVDKEGFCTYCRGRRDVCTDVETDERKKKADSRDYCGFHYTNLKSLTDDEGSVESA